IWQHLLGSPIVRTPGNFGKLGERPTHPELLDYLAQRFVEGGWSVKRLIREIMLSSVYQQASFADGALLKADPENRLLGRMSRKRLEYEAIRDSMLFVSGQLVLSGEPVSQDHRRRTLYEPAERSRRDNMMTMFDGADPRAVVSDRADTTTTPQALFLMNNRFVLQAAEQLAAQMEKNSELKDNESRLEYAFRQLLGRPPTAEEKPIALRYLAKASWTNYFQVLLCANE